MSRTVRVSTVIGIAILLVGAVLVAGGSYWTAFVTCSGTSLSIDRSTGGDPSDSASGRVSFEGLSPVEQRIFLEAYTADGRSATYADWSSSWFDGIERVSYRGDRYEVVAIHADCAPVGVYAVSLGLFCGALAVFVFARGYWTARLRD